MIALQESLEKIGLTDKETMVFLAALELGPQPASSIAKRANLNRSTVYVLLNGLINKGLVSSCVQGGITRYHALDPNKLLRYIDNKREHFNECKREIEDLMPRFRSLINPYQNRPKIRHFEGIEGIKAVMEDTLTAKDTLRCYSSLSKWFDSKLASYIREYGKRRMFEKKIPLKALVFDQPEAREYLDEEYSDILHKCRYVTTGIIDNETNIYDDKVAIVSLREGDYFGLILESPQIAKTQKSIFDLAWKSAA